MVKMNVGDGKFKLEDRLIHYTGDIIEFTKSLNWDFAYQQLKRQLIRSSKSPVLLFGETQTAESDKDYIHKASVLVNELKECRANLKFLNYLN